MTHYLVTDEAGFIGSNIVQRFVELGDVNAVRFLDDFLTGRCVSLAPWLDCIELIEGDIRDLLSYGALVYPLHQTQC